MGRRVGIAVAAVLAVAGAVVAVVLAVSWGDGGPDAARHPGAERPVATETATPTEEETRVRLGAFRPAAYDAWVRRIPERFSVSRGLPTRDDDVTRTTVAVAATFCGTDAFPEGVTTDVRREGVTGSELRDLRDLRLYTDDRSAHGFLAHATRTVLRCPEQPSRDTVRQHDVRPSDLGDEAVLLVRTYETDGVPALGADFWNVVRVGNAVLLTAVSGEYLPGETLGVGIRDHRRRLEPVVAAMCTFSADPC